MFRELRERYHAIKSIIKRQFPIKKELGSCGVNTFIEYPLILDTPSNVHISENVKIRSTLRIINSPNEHVYIKKYTVVSSDCTIITNNHKSTVGVPQFLLGSSHVNDVSKDITIEEDVWVAADVVLLPGAHIGRGCVIGAGSIISMSIPPYSVVVGRGRIIAKKFEFNDVLKHEKCLYPEDERLSEATLKEIFDTHFTGLKVYGCSSTLSDKEKKSIEEQKKIFNYIEPNV